MTEGTTDILGLATVEAGDKLPQGVTKENFEVLDGVQPLLSLKNVSGSTRVAGDVAVTAAGLAAGVFTMTVIRGYRNIIGVVQETIVDDGTGLVKIAGKVDQLKVDQTTAVGDWILQGGITEGVATSSTIRNTPPRGSFAVALTAVTGAGTVEAYLMPSPTTNAYEQSVEENLALEQTSVLSAFGPSGAITITNDYDLGNGWVAVVDGGSITQIPVTTTGVVIWLLLTGTSTGQDVGVVLHPTVGNGSGVNPTLKMSGRLTWSNTEDNADRFMGFSGTPGTFAAGTQNLIGFRKVTTGNIFAVCDDAGTETVVDLGVTNLGALEIIVTGIPTPVAYFYSGGRLVATITTNIPTAVDLSAQLGVRTLTTAARGMTFTGAAVSVALGTA